MSKPLLTEPQIELLESSFQLIAPKGPELVEKFYGELFAQHPELRSMFSDDIHKQEKALLSALRVVVKSLTKPETLVRALTTMGARHANYGAQVEHYPVVKDILLQTMASLAGDAWTPNVAEVWHTALNLVGQTMADAQTQETTKMAQEEFNAASQAKLQELEAVKNGINGINTPIMMVDRDLVVTYVNEGTMEIFRKNARVFADAIPGFDAEKIVGTSIDTFHRNPTHQQRLLADANNLPYQANIQVGPLTFQLNLTAMMSGAGEHVGTTLEWSDVTQQLANDAAREESEKRANSLAQAMKGASTPILMVDQDLVVTFANDATMNLLKAKESELRDVYPGFTAESIMGLCIDVFHKNPAHQRRLLADPRNMPHKARIQVGALSFDLNVTCITGADGTYLGNTLQWEDVSTQVDAESQIAALIESASAGQLNERLDVGNWEGFISTVGGGINQLLDSVVAPLQAARDVAAGLAQGDLTQTVTGDFDGDFKELADALNGSITNLKSMVGQISSGAEDISKGAGEINEGNNNLSSRSQQQAAALEETASTVEQLTGTVKQNADSASQANQLASSARELAEKGGEVVSEAVGAMSEINSSSKKIADIISVIDEIAFQTNLLALNAAVEAARAGEQGRGFAVVAAEVRNLAQRSAGAAKEIKSLISDSVEKVEQGSRLVDKSGQTLGEIVSGVKKVSDIIAEIAAASEEQAAGIEQVNKAVAQMDQMTQQNAALVEEAASASASMDDQAKGLLKLVDYFQMDEEDHIAAPQAQAAPPRPQAVLRSVSNGKTRQRSTSRAPAATFKSRKPVAQEWEDF